MGRGKLLAIFWVLAACPMLRAVNIDSLETALPGMEGLTRFEALKELCWYYTQRVPDKALRYGAENYQLAQALEVDTLIALAARDWGTAYWIAGKLDSAELLCQEAIGRFEKTGGPALAKARYRLSAIYLDEQRFDDALTHLHPALAYFEAHDVNTYLSMVPALSLVYRSLSQDSTAIRILKEALDRNEAAPDPDPLNEAFILGNLAKSEAHPSVRAYDDAIVHLRKAASILKAHNLTSPYRKVINDLGATFSDVGQHDSAMVYGKESLAIAEELGIQDAIMYAHQSLGISYERLGDIPKARFHLLKAVEMGEEVEEQAAFYDLYQALASIEESAGNYKEAFSWLGKAYIIQDTLYRRESLAELNDMQVKYETARKEQELAEERLLTQRQQTFIFGLGGGIITLLLVGFIGYRLFRSRQQQKLQAALIEEQEKGIEGIITAIEAERKRIAKDLHDGVGQQLSALKMGFQRLGNRVPTEQQADLTGLQSLLDQTAADTRSISHQMMPLALTKLGLVPAIEDALGKSLGQTGIHYSFEHFNLQERYPERIEVAVYRILQELINNVIKHSGADQVDIQLFQNGQKLLLMVEDNGQGIKTQKGDGHGMFTIRNRLNPFHGKFNLESTPNEGTTATIAIPIGAD